MPTIESAGRGTRRAMDNRYILVTRYAGFRLPRPAWMRLSRRRDGTRPCFFCTKVIQKGDLYIYDVDNYLGCCVDCLEFDPDKDGRDMTTKERRAVDAAQKQRSDIAL